MGGFGSLAPFMPSASYNTQLDPANELAFRQWVLQNKIPFDANAKGPTDYDMRGYWQGLQNGNPMAAPTQTNPNDGRPHFTDYYKTPLHQSFSAESQWATPSSPQWINGSQLALPSGRIVFDEKQPSDAFTQLLNQLPDTFGSLVMRDQR